MRTPASTGPKYKRGDDLDQWVSVNGHRFIPQELTETRPVRGQSLNPGTPDVDLIWEWEICHDGYLEKDCLWGGRSNSVMYEKRDPQARKPHYDLPFTDQWNGNMIFKWLEVDHFDDDLLVLYYKERWLND